MPPQKSADDGELIFSIKRDFLLHLLHRQAAGAFARIYRNSVAFTFRPAAADILALELIFLHLIVAAAFGLILGIKGTGAFVIIAFAEVDPVFFPVYPDHLSLCKGKAAIAAARLKIGGRAGAAFFAVTEIYVSSFCCCIRCPGC